MKNLTTAAITLCLCLFLTFSINQKSYSQIYEFSHTMNGAGEVPPVVTNGSATVSGTYNVATTTLIWNVTFSGLTAGTTAAHFHGPATPTTNAGVRVGWTAFPLSVTSGNYSRTQVISAAFGTELINGQWYANIHTSFAPGGEIRAHLFPKLRTLNLTDLIEGFYDPGTNLMVSDVVTVNMRDAVSPYGLVDGVTDTLNTSGQGAFTYGTAVSGTPYYIQVLHRNSIETWSAAPQMFTNSSLSYDFTTSDAQAFGNNLKLKGTEYTNFSGDVNQDGAIELTDIINVFNDAQAFISGYVPTDANGDQFVDLGDLVITFNNSQLFVTVMRP